MKSGDTIFALSSGALPAAIAVIRLSGPKTGELLKMLTRRELPSARSAVLRDLYSPAAAAENAAPHAAAGSAAEQDRLLDRAVMIWLPGPASFTGEDMGELHVHGSPAIIEALSQIFLGFQDVRLAEAGEFSRRAFEAGKLDLTEIEGIADLIAARTSAQHRQAARQMAGELGARYALWRKAIVEILAECEALIDFADEDLPAGLEDKMKTRAQTLVQEMLAALDDGRRGERLREGLEVAIIGAPNAGKSSLINALSKREAAIVTALPGTTRDVIEVELDIGGFPLVLADTAGLRASADLIESEGIRRALKRAETADLRIIVADASEAVLSPDVESQMRPGDLLVWNKIDLLQTPPDAGESYRNGLAVSLKTGAGLAALIGLLQERAGILMGMNEPAVITRARHRKALGDTAASLRRFADAAGQPAELGAEDLRIAVRCLGRVTGEVDVEEVLGVIFAEFCIGK